jgi:multiple sugar transport system permease protein
MPAALLVLFVLVYPVLSSLYYSFTDRNLLKTDYDFIGFANYAQTFQDDRFWKALSNSVIWTAASVSLQILLGFGAALLLNRIHWFKGMFRTVLIIPWAFPSLVIAFTWTWLMNDQYGFINAILLATGLIHQPILWLADPGLAMISMVLINVWFGFPFMMVSILAALQTIPKDEYEAAAIDGASAWQSFVHITFKHVRIIIGLIAVVRTIWVFNNFEFIFLTTGGGPGNATETLPLYAYRTGWVLSALGKSSAIATILVLLLIIVTSVYLRLLNRWERYDF